MGQLRHGRDVANAARGTAFLISEDAQFLLPHPELITRRTFAAPDALPHQQMPIPPAL
jgi:hypothetical protein